MSDTSKAKRGTKRKAPEASSTPTEPDKDLDYSADELERPSHTAVLNSTSASLAEIKNTLNSLKQCQTDVTDRLTQFGLRMDKGEITDYAWHKTGLQKQTLILLLSY